MNHLNMIKGMMGIGNPKDMAMKMLSQNNNPIFKNLEIPLDGSISYFPLVNGTAIATKQLMQDGTSKITIYEPKVEKESIKYATIDDIDKKIEKLGFSEIDDLKEDLSDLKREFKEIKSKLKTKKED